MKAPSLKLPDIKIPDLPKSVQLSLTVMAVSLALFIALSLTLGTATDDAEASVVRLRADINSIQKNANQTKEDFDFIKANQQRFDALMAGDKLVPHTRRTAIRQMQSLALESGLSALNYNFQAAGSLAPEAVAQQPKSDLYRVYVETIELQLGAPLDQNIYSFLASAYDNFPGSMVVNEIELGRMRTITKEALNNVSAGRDSGIVSGKIRYSWRTAQRNQQDGKK